MTKLSVAIAAYNEEKNIKDCLESAKFADEIVVVDGKSTDNTGKIAKSLGAKVFEVPNQPLMKKNMNLSFEKATGDWIISLDADERITEELANEIRSTIENPGDFVAFKIPRKNIIFNAWIAHTGWYPDYQFRLFKKGKAKFPEKNVHEELVVDGEVGELKNPIVHQHIATVSDWLGRMDNYTSREAEKIIKEGKKISWSDSIRFPLEEFLRRFFAWQGYKDGLHGLVLSLLMAFYWELVFAKVWEHEKFWPHNNDNFLSEVVSQSNGVSKEFHHWVAASSKNPLIKIKHKIRRHL